jgi:OmpA-OmpF porin, OOP family
MKSTFQCCTPARKSVLFGACLAFVWVGAEKVVRAEVNLFDVRRFSPPTDPQGSLVLEPVTTQGHLAWTAGFLESYAHRVLVLKDTSGNDVAVPLRDQLSFDALFNIGIGKRLAFGLRMPAVMGQTGDTLADSSSRVPRSALGDLTLDAKATLLPRGSLGGFGVAALARMSAPTGDAHSGVATRGITSDLRLLGEIDWIILALRASAGVQLRSERQVLFSDTFGQELPWAVGLLLRPRALGIDRRGRWQWFLESSGALALTPKFGAARGSPATFGIASRYAVSQDFSALAGVQVPLDSAVGVPSVRFVIGISWAPRFQDADADGIADDKDDCPELAEDKDGVEDDDGCPEE